MTALNLTRERAEFEASGTRLHGWGERDYELTLRGEYTWSEQVRAFALWCEARRAALAQSPVSAEGLVWIDAKLRPPEPGLIVKRWNGGSVWAGIYRGDAKGSSCDWWMPLPGDV